MNGNKFFNFDVSQDQNQQTPPTSQQMMAPQNNNQMNVPTNQFVASEQTNLTPIEQMVNKVEEIEQLGEVSVVVNEPVEELEVLDETLFDIPKLVDQEVVNHQPANTFSNQQVVEQSVPTVTVNTVDQVQTPPVKTEETVQTPVSNENDAMQMPMLNQNVNQPTYNANLVTQASLPTRKKSFVPTLFLLLLIGGMAFGGYKYGPKIMEMAGIKGSNSNEAPIIEETEVIHAVVPNEYSNRLFINDSIGITYVIPNYYDEKPKYIEYELHGMTFKYNDITIYIEKSLEDNKDLKELANSIIDEKNSDKYNFIYGNKFYNYETSELANKRINDIDMMYFSGKTAMNSGEYTDVNSYSSVVGYSFKYNDDSVSIYAFIHNKEESNEEDTTIKDVGKLLQNIISSVKPYDGKSLHELSSDLNGLAIDNLYEDDRNAKFIINTFNSSKLDYIPLSNTEVTWDKTLNGIINICKDQESTGDNLEARKYTCPWIFTDGVNIVRNKYEITKEDNFKINGIDFKKYIIKANDDNKDVYNVVYTFIVDERPYMVYSTVNLYTDGTTNHPRGLNEDNIDFYVSYMEKVTYYDLLSFKLEE